MSTDYEVINLDLYQECIEPLESDTQANVCSGTQNTAYEYANQWTTIHPDPQSYS